MHCTNHPDREALTSCSSCEAMFCRECLFSVDEGLTVCARCKALLASRDTSREIERGRNESTLRKEAEKHNKTQRKRRVMAAQIGVVIIALIVAIIQVPRINESLQPPAPLRIGDYETDARIDECIAVLWQVSKKLQKGELPGDELVCSASEKPFVIIKDTEGNMTARVPQPKLYGFSEMRVSTRHPIPEVIR